MKKYVTNLIIGLCIVSIIPCATLHAKTPANPPETPIPLTILGRGVNAPELPITVGIPFADGKITSLDNVSILNEKGEPIPYQHNTLATWVKPGSGSIKWALFDFRVKGLDKAEKLLYTLQLDQPKKKPVARPYANKVTRANGKLTVDTGKLRFTMKERGCGLIGSASVI